jgi:hypothetical protein
MPSWSGWSQSGLGLLSILGVGGADTGRFFSLALVATTATAVAAFAPKEVDLAFPGSALFLAEMGAPLGLLAGLGGQGNLSLPSGAWVGASFVFLGRGGRAPVAWSAGRAERERVGRKWWRRQGPF